VSDPGRFTIIGTFDTNQAAEEAANQFRTILETIISWYDLPENEAIAQEVLRNYEHAPVEPELQIAEQYGIEWISAVDWLANSSIESPNHVVKVFDNLLFVSNAAPTNLGEPPFDQLMAKFTNQVVIHTEAGPAAFLVLTCRVPNEQTGKDLFNEINVYFASAPHETVIPWINYHPDNTTSLDLHELATRFHRHYQEKQRAYLQVSDEIQQVKKALGEASRTGNSVLFELLQEQLSELRQVYTSNTPIISQADDALIIHLNADLYGGGKVSLEENILSIRMWFGKVRVGLPVLLAYLSDQGCTSIDYKFVQN
jgi:hypothetical protein